MPTMTAVEKAELARLRCAAPTTIPAFAEARARRLAELEARYLAETADTPSPSPTPEPQRDKWALESLCRRFPRGTKGTP